MGSSTACSPLPSQRVCHQPDPRQAARTGALPALVMELSQAVESRSWAGMLLGLPDSYGLSGTRASVASLGSASRQLASAGAARMHRADPHWYATALPPPRVSVVPQTIRCRELSETLGGGGNRPPCSSCPWYVAGGALPCPSLHMPPCSPKSPRASATSSLTGHHLTWSQLRDSLPDPSLVALCPVLLPDSSRAEMPAAVPLALLRWKRSE